MKTSISPKNIALIAALIAAAIGWRLLNHEYGFAYNLELVTAVSVLAALRFGWKAGLVTSLVAMVVSDIIIGNTNILIFTWGAFTLIGLGAALLRRLNGRTGLQIAAGVGFAALSSTVFFLITNFGVWLQGYYPPTIDGLILSYAMGIPFYKNMLIGNLILVPSAIAAWQLARSYYGAGYIAAYK